MRCSLPRTLGFRYARAAFRELLHKKDALAKGAIRPRLIEPQARAARHAGIMTPFTVRNGRTLLKDAESGALPGNFEVFDLQRYEYLFSHVTK
jgi:hypothetical protein